MARRRFLEIVADGGFVYLAHGVVIYKAARREAGLGPTTDKSLAEEVRTLFQDLGAALNDAEFYSWSGADVGSRDRRTTHLYLMPSAVAHVEIAKLHESLLAVEKELAECKKMARMYQAKEHAPERGSSVQEKKLAVVEEAGSIIRNDIQLHPAWDNCRRKRDHLKDFDMEIPDPLEYVNNTIPRTLAVLLTRVCGRQDLLAEGGAGVEQGGGESVVAGGRGESAVAGGGGESVSAGGGGEPTSVQSAGGARRRSNKDESRDAVFMYMVGTMAPIFTDFF